MRFMVANAWIDGHIGEYLGEVTAHLGQHLRVLLHGRTQTM